jgi:hypothetical protein
MVFWMLGNRSGSASPPRNMMKRIATCANHANRPVCHESEASIHPTSAEELTLNHQESNC